MNRIVMIDNPHIQVEFDDSLDFATVTMQGKTYPNLSVKRKWLGHKNEYIYTIIVPIAPLPAKRYMLAIGKDALYGYVHPEREPFPEIHDSEPMEIKSAKKGKREKPNQLKLF